MRTASPSSPLWNGLTDPARSVALEVLYHGPLSRAELARRLSLSAGSLTRLSKPLLDSGLLIEVGTQLDNRIGRPAVLLDVEPTSRHFVGVKLTGDEAHAVLTTLRAEVVASQRAPLHSHDPDHVVSTVGELVSGLVGHAPDTVALGVSVGGRADDNTTVTSAPFLDWTDVPLGKMASDATGLPCVVENDVVAVTEAEHWFGAGRDCERFALITIGAGVGYGLVVHDQLVGSPDIGTGLAGHISLDPGGPPCGLGHKGCAAAMLTIPAIHAAVSVGLQREVSYDECLDLALRGDPVASRVVTDAGRALGRLIALVGNLTMPHKIILTGDGIRLASVAEDVMLQRIADERDAAASTLDLDVQTFDFFEWARGAAVIAIQKYVLGHLSPATSSPPSPSR
ncbi:ROK family transcriptional regulator [Actinobacteria bacterium YIM 96077]|uniref:MarR family transcriptional regulator n=1 Tax=Phytoactinopolyspora halophila TaxID=1981511 RepID=A0A329QGL4_9ACTN|nr:ROK family transcriptional regulator [Phytoactinopolyspora halophila]AYY12492.1 ROK family transcriptional regulator [Actinobacteria bacterium YIM 96077]RAW09448.1 MarR family transcriptional regulator [Phytoactinopolyspora halophila]